MNRKQIISHNMEYLNLNIKQYLEHEKLMKRKVSKWPKILLDHIEKEQKIYGFCGDALACWLADYIRGRDSLIDGLKP